MLIAQEAYDFIVRQEVSSPAYYERHYRRPEWPGGASGVTIACGYDLGYASPEKIRRDWSTLVPPAMLDVLIHCSGVKGQEARALLPAVRDHIDIPWAAADNVFRNSDLPQWTAKVQRDLPNCDKISPLCLGMHVSTAYNRGDGGYSSNGSRFSEMHAIKNDMASKNFSAIGNEFRSMCRLWPTMKGLRDRYRETATLWDKGLTQMVSPAQSDPPIPHDGEHPFQAGPARTKPPATTPTQHGAAGGVVAGGVVVAHQAAQSGSSTAMVVSIVAFFCVLAAAFWFAVYRNRNP